MFNIYVIPVNESTNEANKIALYTTDINSKDGVKSVVNYGRPGLAPYNAMLGNMYGYDAASEKYEFEIISEEECKFKDEYPIYLVVVNDDRKVAQTIVAMNEEAEKNPIFSSTIFKSSLEKGKEKKKAL